MNAKEILDATDYTMGLRGANMKQDEPGERSMPQIVAVYNAVTGQSMSVADGYRFMLALKLVREANRETADEDDYVDFVGYAALLGEHQTS